ncbi:MAG: cation:proton antiporter, partial [Gaiellales bacterium]|nr:cation:proton antiporter [Gaiellales bacterium]
MYHVFEETALILLLAAVLGFIGLQLRQPLIISFIALGIIAGPWGLDLVHGQEQIELLAGIGISLLLFVVGLKLDFRQIRTTGRVSLATGLGQVVFTSVIGFGIVLAFGLPVLEAVYVAIALTFSSTIIIIKLLTDKMEIDSLHGRIAVGFLIVQDGVAIIALILLSAFAGREANEPLWYSLLLVAGKGVALLAVLAVVTRFVLPWLLHHMARCAELLVLFGVAWAVALAAAAELLGFSKELGAFLAGVSLAFTPYREELSARLATIRDFLLLFFFLDLGASLQLAGLGQQAWQALILSLFVLIGNPLVVMVIMGVMGYRGRTSLLAGLTVAQISEFSLILIAMGASIGHVTESTVGLVTLVGLVTIGLSTYMIVYSRRLYGLLAPVLRVFERKGAFAEAAADRPGDGADVDVVLIGLGRYGSDTAELLLARGQRIVGVDFDPAVLNEWGGRGVNVVYADAEDPDMVSRLPLSSAHWVLCDVPDVAVGTTLARRLREAGYKGRVALAARRPEDTALCAAAGADL